MYIDYTLCNMHLPPSIMYNKIFNVKLHHALCTMQYSKSTKSSAIGVRGENCTTKMIKATNFIRELIFQDKVYTASFTYNIYL